MLSVLGSLVFLLAAFGAIGVVGLTFAAFWDRALANLAAFRATGETREFRYSTVGVVRHPPVPARRMVIRAARRLAFSPAQPLRAAA